jgi:hypothetical protein
VCLGWRYVRLSGPRRLWSARGVLSFFSFVFVIEFVLYKLERSNRLIPVRRNGRFGFDVERRRGGDLVLR